jgi:molecular chaperone GrpE
MSDDREEVPDDVEPPPEPASIGESIFDSPDHGDATVTSFRSESDLLPIEDLSRALGNLGDRLLQRLDAIQTVLERESRAEITRERVIDRLHAELQDYKQDLLLKVQRPIFLDLIQLHDDIGKMVEAMTGSPAEPDRAVAVRGTLESIQVAIEDILYRQGVEPFTAEGDAFDPRRQRAVATVATEDPDRNRTIAARLRKGFQAGEKVIRPELVSVYTFRLPSPTDSPA